MAMDFVIIEAVRARIGGTPSEGEAGVEQDAQFVGASIEKTFSCPGVDREQMAVLQFESIGIDWQVYPVGSPNPYNFKNVIQINGVDIPGGLQKGPTRENAGIDYPLWKTHCLLVPAGILKEKDNKLYIEAMVSTWHGAQDNFIVDNMVLFYKVAGRVNEVGDVLERPILEQV